MTNHPDHADAMIAVLCAAQCAGNPVPGGDPQRWQRIVRIAHHRWSTFRRRHPSAPDTPAARVEDLARGLLDRLGRHSENGAPLEITDCRDLAQRLATVLSTTPSAASTGIRAAWMSR